MKMCMILLLLVSCHIVVVLSHVGHHHDDNVKNEKPATLLISFDGFRWDYLQTLRNLTDVKKEVTNYFDQLISSGSYAPDGIENVFVTKTFPNHYTLVTGLYEQNHGILGNSVYDPTSRKQLSLISQKSESAHLYGGEPIWITYSKQKTQEQVGCYMWVGCDIKINHFENFVLNRVVHYDRNASCDDRIEWTLRWLSGGVRLVLLYFDEPDSTGHSAGTSSQMIGAKLLELNECLGRLLDSLRKSDLWPSNLNMIVASDHGMIEFNSTVMLDLTNSPLYEVWAWDYTNVLIHPFPGKMDATLNYLGNLTGTKVYLHDNIPTRWHYKHEKRIPEILLTADLGVKNVDNNDKSHTSMIAGHGYDNQFDQMRPIFIASGPSFKKNHTIEKGHFRTVDVYLLLCHLFDLKPAPSNGSYDNVIDLLSFHHDQIDDHFLSTLIVILCSTVVVSFILCIVTLHRASLNKRHPIDIESIPMKPLSDGNGVIYQPTSVPHQVDEHFSLNDSSEDENELFSNN